MSTTETIFEDIEAKYTKQAYQTPENIYAESEAFTLACERQRAEQYELHMPYYQQWKDKALQKEIAEKTASLLKTGFPIIDNRVKIYGKRVIIIVGRSEYGKTSFAAQMMRKQLLDNKNILFFSCEEAGEDFITRINLSQELDEKATTNFYMIDKGNITLEDIKMTCLKLDILGLNPDIVYVDQLNKIKPETDFKGSKHERIVHISEQLQNIVKIINRPLVILHQANRAAEANEGFMTQANVSDADAIFNESQITFFIESPEYFEWCKTKEPYKDIFQYVINIGKNRSKGGWKGAEPCYFDRSKGIFLTLDEYNQKESIKQYEDYRSNF